MHFVLSDVAQFLEVRLTMEESGCFCRSVPVSRLRHLLPGLFIAFILALLQTQHLSAQTTDQLRQQATAAASRGDWEEAIQLGRQFAEQSSHDGAIFAARLHGAYAQTLQRANRIEACYEQYALAAEVLDSVVIDSDSLNDPDRAYIATSFYNAACAHSLRDRTELAVQCIEKAIESGFDDLELIRTDSDLDSIRDRPKLQEFIEELAERPDVQASSLDKRGRDLLRQGKYQEAIKSLTEALKLREEYFNIEKYPNGHVRIAASLNILGHAYKRSRNHAPAVEFLSRCLEMRKQIYTPEEYPRGHHELSAALNDMGSVHRARGDLAKAEVYFRKSLVAREKLYPQDEYPRGHSNLVIALANLAITLSDAGNLDEARDLYQRNYEMCMALYPEDRYPNGSQNTLYALKSLANIERLLGRPAEAEVHARASIAAAKRLYPTTKYPDGHPELSETYTELGLVLSKLGRHRDALDQFRLVRETYALLYPPKQFPRGAMDWYFVLQNLGDAESELGHHSEARQWYEQALDLIQRLYPTERFPHGHPNVVQVQEKLAGLYEEFGDSVRVESLRRAVVATMEHYYPESDYPNGHPDLARALNSLGMHFRKQNRLADARQHYDRAWEMRKRLYPKSRFPDGHPDLSNSLASLGTFCLSAGEPESARKYYAQHLASVRAQYPPSKYPDGHPNVAKSLTNYGQALGDLGNHAEASRIYQEALQLFESLYPEGNPASIRTRLSLGSALLELGDSSAAESQFAMALEHSRLLYPPQDFPNGHPDLDSTLSHLAEIKEERGDLNSAERLYRESLEYCRKQFPIDEYPKGHVSLAVTINHLGSLLQRAGRNEAEPLLLESLKMREDLFPKSEFPEGHIMLARAYNGLALLYQDQGKYDEARRWLESSLAMREKLYPPSIYPNGHSDLARGYSNYAVFLEEMGEFDAAVRNHRKALAMRLQLYPKTHYPRGHSEIILSMHNLGVVLKTQRKLDESEKLHRDNLANLKRLYPSTEYPSGHFDFARTWNSLASVLRAKGETEKALEYFESAFAMRQRLLNQSGISEHALLSGSLNNIAAIKSDLGDQKGSLEFYNRALAMERIIYPQGHPDTASVISGIAQTHYEMGDFDAAWRFIAEAEQMRLALAQSHLLVTSEAEALNYQTYHLERPDVLISTWEKLDLPADALYPFIWNRRALVQRLTSHRNRLLHEASASGANELFQQWQDLRKKISSLVMSPATGDSQQRAAKLDSLAELTARKEALERRLNTDIPGFSTELQLAETEPQQLASRLSSRTAYVEFLTFSRLPVKGGKPESICLAFVVLQGRPVRCATIGSVDEINSVTLALRNAMLSGSHSEAATQARRLLWQPIEETLPAEVENLVLCPEGALTRVPWTLLPLAEPGTVLLDKFQVTTVPYGPFLLSNNSTEEHLRKETAAERVLAVGDVDYDSGADKSLDDSVQWIALPATKIEIDAIESKAGKRPVQRISGRDASVNRVSQMMTSATFAHFATHGFFANKQFRSELQLDEELFRPSNYGERRSVATRNPLTLSGLVLSGANHLNSDTISDSVADTTILTGEAIAGLPLHDLRLAVLSACDTGLGEVEEGEGVFGLQRAFHQAGAETVIASLWKVDDRATRVLMERFYENLWGKKMNASRALREAQLWVREHPEELEALGVAATRGSVRRRLATRPPDIADENNQFTHPYYWAAFQLSGGVQNNDAWLKN